MEREFVDVRMIVLHPGLNVKTKDGSIVTTKDEFSNWMTKKGGFLDEFVGFFGDHGLKSLTFLQGNKWGPHSNEPKYPVDTYKYQAATGANADFAWIAHWTNIKTNDETWTIIKYKNDANIIGTLGYTAWNKETYQKWETFSMNWWADFFKICHPRVLGGLNENAYIPTRPEHGPPYDYLGGVPRVDYPHYGRGAGCLVEGFNVVYDAEIKNGEWTATIAEIKNGEWTATIRELK